MNHNEKLCLSQKLARLYVDSINGQKQYDTTTQSSISEELENSEIVRYGGGTPRDGGEESKGLIKIVDQDESMHNS